jgi:SAM-dependent methyltransferase
VVDVGGASGTLIAAVLEAHAQIQGVLFDLPHAVEAARTRLEVAGVADRCDLVAGDFLVGVPQGGDVYVLARVLLNWDDDRARSILANCRRAMKVGGKLLVVDFVPSNDYRAITTISDLTLMVLFSQAHLRGEDELAALLRQTGFAVEQVERLASHPLLCLVEACLEESDCSTR